MHAAPRTAARGSEGRCAGDLGKMEVADDWIGKWYFLPWVVAHLPYTARWTRRSEWAVSLHISCGKLQLLRREVTAVAVGSNDCYDFRWHAFWINGACYDIRWRMLQNHRDGQWRLCCVNGHHQLFCTMRHTFKNGKYEVNLSIAVTDFKNSKLRNAVNKLIFCLVASTVNIISENGISTTFPISLWASVITSVHSTKALFLPLSDIPVSGSRSMFVVLSFSSCAPAVPWPVRHRAISQC